MANRAALKTILAQLGIRPRRSAGQHFLVDPQTVDDLVDAADVRASETVLEVGPGLGVVTEALANRGATVLAIELDRTLAAWLTRRYRGRPNITVVQGDIRRWRLPEYVQDGRYKVVSSLPFNVTSLVLRRWLEHPPRPTVLSLLIQKEVAERVTAPPGRMSLLSVSVQYLGTPTIVRPVSQELFWPPPEVDGAVIRIEVKPLPPEAERKKLWRLARIGYSARRKMLYRNLAAGLRIEPAKVNDALRSAGLNEGCRAQDVRVEQWLALAKKLL
ncbi:MAG: ribosomal RNA small subunit methyltransferase A [Candidatus Kerfeldbacteria bacterium]|nr:ribosomal RNA small subunit methyltransferase A [Candidatus Kerfeldbacteria bacterium]